MRKPVFGICENKEADQLRGDREADQRLCFRYIDTTIPLHPIYEISIEDGCTARFVSDQVGNPEDRLSHNEAHLIIQIQRQSLKQRIMMVYHVFFLEFNYMRKIVSAKMVIHWLLLPYSVLYIFNIYSAKNVLHR